MYILKREGYGAQDGGAEVTCFRSFKALIKYLTEDIEGAQDIVYIFNFLEYPWKKLPVQELSRKEFIDICRTGFAVLETTEERVYVENVPLIS